MSRVAVCLVLFAGACLLTGSRPGTALAQDKTKKDLAAEKQQILILEKQLKVAQLELQQAAQQMAGLKMENARLQSLLKKDKADDAKDDKTIKSLQTTIDGYRGAGLVHVVVLKLKPNSPSTETQSVIDDANAQLTKIKGVRGLWAGRPASKGTADAASDYTVALVLVFDDAAGLKAYLNDPAHTKFADKHLKKWETPLVYDFEPKKAAP